MAAFKAQKAEQRAADNAFALQANAGAEEKERMEK